MNHRGSVDNCNRCQNQGLEIILGQIRRTPEFWSDGIRHRDGMNFVQALIRNLGSCRPMSKERFKQRTCKNLSTKAEHSGGVMHSSVETALMAEEPRHDLIRSRKGDNCEAG